jgi:xylulokinase
VTGEPVLAGVDVGTTNTKLGLYRPDGTRLTFQTWPTPGDADKLVSGVLDGLASQIGQIGQPPDAIGVAGMAESGVTVDADLTPLHPLILWRDPQGSDGVDRIAAEPGAAGLFAIAGVSLGTKTPLARWRWLTDTRPDLLTGSRVWLGAPDLVAAALTGEPVTDLTLAGRTGGMDVRGGRWHPDLLAAAGIGAGQLPRIADPGQPAGRCGTDQARSAGLRPGTPVVVAGHDHLVAGYAAGVRRPGEQMDSMGTAEAVVTVTTGPPEGLPPGTGVSWNRFVDGTHYCLVSGFPGAGRLVEWFTNGYLGLTGQAGRRRFESLVDAVKRRPTGIVVEPYLSGRAAPAPDPGRGLAVHGLRPRHTVADLGLALLEGACAQVRWLADEHLSLLGAAGPGPVVAGGPTRSGAWMRVKAAFGTGPLRVVDDPDAACAGAALLAGSAGLGLPAPVLAASPVTPDESERHRYHRFYRDSFLPVVTGTGLQPDDPWESP